MFLTKSTYSFNPSLLSVLTLTLLYMTIFISLALYLPTIVILENVEHCGGEPEQAATMATCT